MTQNTRNKTTVPQLTQSDLHQFTGDILRYAHALNRKIIFTPGVKFVADRAQAYWLVDAIASYFGSPQMNDAIKNNERLATLQFWKLEVSEVSAVLTARADADVAPFVTQEIEFTDFPLSQIDIWAGFDGQYWTLYLPTEH